MSSSGHSPPTFFITDRRMLAHKCEWDSLHVDTPGRLKSTLDLLEKEQLLEKCHLLDSTDCSLQDLQRVHSPEHIQRIQRASEAENQADVEQMCRGLEDIYMNSHSWECGRLSAGCAVRAMEAVLAASPGTNQQNGTSNGHSMTTTTTMAANSFAAIRPPGHHASRDAPCGFCLFNNVAVCAKKARAMGVERVLIVDWDLHAAQGTQYSVEGDPGILLVSIHRYEQGQFWPELPECGLVHKYENTINVPMDEIGYGDAEYAAFMHSLVLPLIRQWQPGLILVSCGFDAGIGDSVGEMEVTPAGFGYLTGLLAQQGVPLCLVLEGGYFLDSVVQGTRFCLRALLERAPPVANFCQRSPAPKFLRTLYTVLHSRAMQFPVFHEFLRELNDLRQHLCATEDRRKRRQLAPIQLPSDGKQYLGDRRPAELAMAQQKYQTRGAYRPREAAVERQFSLRIRQLVEEYGKGRVERTRLELELNAGGHLQLKHAPNGGTSNGREPMLRLASVEQFRLIYHFFLLPLDFTLFDVQLDGFSLPLNALQMDRVVAKLERQGLTARAMNGHGNNGKKKRGEGVDVLLEPLLDLFAQMKPFFLFP